MKKHLWLCIPLKAGLLTFLILNSTFIILNSPLASAQAPNFLWAQSAGETSTDVGYSVSTDAGGNVFVTGYFQSPTITFGTTTLTNAGASGNADIFIVKYDPSGNVLWAKSDGGTGSDFGYSCSTDLNGNIFVTGYFQSSSITFGTTTLTNANSGSGDIFIVKYDASGTVLWAKSEGGTSLDEGYSISTAPGGTDVFVTGSFGSPTITFGTTTLTNAGGSDIFIVKYDNSGTVLWAKSEGGTSTDDGFSVSADAGGNVFVTGSFWGQTITFGTTTLTNAGSADIFIAKLGAVAGIESPLTTENEIIIYPNPTSGKFVVQITNQYRFTDYELEIYNVFGEKVTQSVIPNGVRNLTLDLSEAPSGIYFIKIIPISIGTAQGTVNKKIVITR